MPPIKKSQVKPEDAKNLVQEYMKQQYRPYSTNDIHLNMHNIVTKAKLGNILDSLVSENELICKTIGKTNYYTYKQLNVGDSETDTPMADYEELQDTVKKLNQEIGEMKSKLQEVSATLTNQELTQSIANHTLQIEKLKAELEKSQKDETTAINPEILSAYVARLKRVKKQRRDMFKNLIGVVSEIMDIENLLELCGIDEEEYAKFK